METIDVRETARRLGLGLKAVRDLSDHGVLTNVQPVTPGAQKHYRHFAVREVSALKKVYVKRAGVKYLKMRMREQLGPGPRTNGTGGHPDTYGPNPGDVGDLEPVTTAKPPARSLGTSVASGPSPAPTGPRGLLARLEAMELLLGALEETMTSQAVQLHDLDRSIQQLLKVWTS